MVLDRRAFAVRSMSTVGILGGGQLARMLALAGTPLGQRFLVVDSAADACAGDVAPLVQTGWDDAAGLAEFARRVDVATFDFENVPAETARLLTAHTRVFPPPAALAVAQDRLAEKNLFREIGLDTPAFAAVDTREDLDRAVAAVGLPAVLKTRRLGYDGKGQRVLRDAADLDPAWADLGAAPLILEQFVAFDAELSVIAVRTRGGEFRHYPVTRNWHADGILSASLALPGDTDAAEAGAVAHARALAQRLEYVGVFALELFRVGERILGNEIAPRVHNSGHWTIEGCACSQFENHVRAILDLPLGDTRALAPSVMLNWVGELPDARAALTEPRVHWHDYGKSPRPGRKVGHATICATSASELDERLRRVGGMLDRTEQVAPVLDLLASLRD
jgi:5-(carboxyamino)imidazole ribonucleotide synthase